MINIATTRNGNTTPFGLHGKLHVEGKHLYDSTGSICQLRGLSSHNLNSYPEYINEDAITQFVDEYGITIFRLAMYSGAADGVNGYADGDDSLRDNLEKLIVKGVEICAKLGIYVMVDWHILLDYDPNMHTDMAIRFFKSICPVLKDYDNVIYEICNEPNMDTTWEQIVNYANQVIPVIKAIDPDKVISVGTPVWSQRVDQAAEAPLDFDNLVYSLHFYAATHKDNIRDLMHTAIDKNLPIFVTEFGICDASGNGGIDDEQTNIWLDELDKNKISYILWNLSNKAETSAILKPECSKVSAFSDSDLSECGTRFISYMKRQ